MAPAGRRWPAALDELLAREPARFKPLYDWAAPVKTKIHTIATRMYGAERVAYTKRAEGQIAQAEKLGYGGLPICMAKTQRSLVGRPRPSSGRPRDFTVTVNEVRISAGAGFLVPITGEILTMPGLPRVAQRRADGRRRRRANNGARLSVHVPRGILRDRIAAPRGPSGSRDDTPILRSMTQRASPRERSEEQ